MTPGKHDKDIFVTETGKGSDEVSVLEVSFFPSGQPERKRIFVTEVSSGGIVDEVTQPYQNIITPELKEYMVETVERSKKHFWERLKFEVSIKDLKFNFELERKPEKTTRMQITAKKEK
ncbi:MAG: hypothetical protein HXY44_12150 [Syntrophaceae bacterium]|nr:hypothetical protein [Syntrophaceae bacterium]